MNKPVNCRCGGEAIIYINGARQAKIYCEKCGIESNIFATKYKAIEVWNRVMGERTAKASRNPQAFFYHCECGYALCCEKNDMNYCPNCGARLEWE